MRLAGRAICRGSAWICAVLDPEMLGQNMLLGQLYWALLESHFFASQPCRACLVEVPSQGSAYSMTYLARVVPACIVICI